VRKSKILLVGLIISAIITVLWILVSVGVIKLAVEVLKCPTCP